MKDSAYKISLDINGSGSQLVLNARHMDTGRKLYVSLRSGGEPYIIEKNCYAAFAATKPDGTALYNACEIEGNEIVYEFTEQTCSVIGRSRCEIILYGPDDKVITSPRFALLVDGTICPEGKVVSTDEFTELTHATSEAIEATGAANDAATKANTAATDALGAAQRASDATLDAEDATTRADNAAQKANTATGAANQAAAAATQSAQDANTAAGEARYAADGADGAAAIANQAAQAANSASINANQAATKAAHTAKSLMVVGKAEGANIYLDDAIDQFFVGCRIFGKTTQNGVPTPDAPVELASVGDRGSIGLAVCGGKNLIPYPYKNTSKTQGGITFTDNGDGSITINGTATTNAYFVLCSIDFGNKWVGGTADSFTSGVYTFSLKNAVSDKVVLIYESGITKNLFIRVTAGSTVSNLTVYPQAEYGSVATAYEPYKGQTLSISTPNGLPGIPVASGGNYTDASGQQWICDEIDFSRGVHIQRVAKKELDGSEVWSQAGGGEYFSIAYSYLGNTTGGKSCCSHFGYDSNGGKNYFVSGTVGFAFFHVLDSVSDWKAFLADQFTNGSPVTLIFPVAKPIETPLSEEELAAYAALHTYRGNTTVSNDASAHMEIEYVMDAKKYIDRLVTGTGTIVPATVE